MRWWLLLSCLVMASAVDIRSEQRSSEAEPEDSALIHTYDITLGEISLKTTMQQTFFVAFVSSKCVFSKKLVRGIEAIRKHAGRLNATFGFYTADASNTEVLDEYDIEVEKTPAVYLFIGRNKPVRYEGSNRPEHYSAFAQRMKTLTMEQLHSADQIETFKAKSRGGVAVLFSHDDSEQRFELVRHVVIRMAAIEMTGVVGYMNMDIAISAGMEDVVYVYGPDKRVTSLGYKKVLMMTPEALFNWVKLAAQPTVHRFSDGAERIFELGIADVLFYVASKENVKNAMPWLSALGEKKLGKLVVAVIESDDVESHPAMGYLGVPVQTKKPAVRIFRNGARVFRMEVEATEENVAQFVASVEEGKMEPHYRTAELSKDWNRTHIKQLVGSNFKEVAFDKERFVLVLFTIPDCVLCKDFHNDFEVVAKHFKDVDKMVIAEINLSENDVDDDHDDVAEFPAMRLYMAETNAMTQYNGPLDEDSLMEWLSQELSDDNEKTGGTEDKSGDKKVETGTSSPPSGKSKNEKNGHQEL